MFQICQNVRGGLSMDLSVELAARFRFFTMIYNWFSLPAYENATSCFCLHVPHSFIRASLLKAEYILQGS